MTGTLPTTSSETAPVREIAVPVPVPAAAAVAAPRITSRAASTVRPWSAVVCGLDDDRTLLVVDWLLLACREAGLVGQAVPLADGTDLHGMYVEVAADETVESCFGELPWGAVDLVVAGEHLELLRAIDAGFVDPDVTTVVASCRRTFTDVERVVAPQHVVREREIDAIATARSLAYHAFDGHEVARWYGLSAQAQPGLLLGAVSGSGVTGLDESCFRDAIGMLGIDVDLQRDAFGRGTRLGRRPGGRVRRVRTAYQFTRRRRALVDYHSRRQFEELVARAEELVQVEHVPVLQEAIFQLCEFQDSAWAAVLVEHVDALVRAEQELLGETPPAHRSIVPDAVRSLASMLVWPDGAWIANRKIRRERLKQIRSAHGVTRRDRYELVEHIPLDALERAAARSKHLPAIANTTDASVPPLLQPLRIEQVTTTSVRGALRLRRLAASARNRTGSARERLELDTVESWLHTMRDALQVDHEIARIVARSGTLVQGSGAVREANRATAHAFWGRIVRQSIALDAGAGDGGPSMAVQVVPFVWDQLCRSGPLALWEYAAQVLGIALARSRGQSIADTRALVNQLCQARRPVR